MTEEQNSVKEEKCNCICHSKGFRKFLIVALGTFVGVYCALCLFAAIHRPPMPPCPMAGCPLMRPPIECQRQHINRIGNIDKKIAPDKNLRGERMPFDAPAPNLGK